MLATVGVAIGQTGMSQLVTAAKQEGQLTTIALPHDWCGYGELIASYKQKYGLKVNELNPDAGSGDEALATEQIDAQVKGEPITTGFNPQFLLDGLTAIFHSERYVPFSSKIWMR